MAFNIDEKYIKETEERLKMTFPKSYKRIMKENNGGTILLEDDWELFPIQDKLDRKRISRTSNHIIYETDKAREWTSFPSHALAIASDGSGNLLILKKEGDRYLDKIYSWNHETGEITQVSNDFNELEIE